MLRGSVSKMMDRINFLERRNAELERENAELRRALRRDLAEQTVAYREIESRLDALEKPILKLVLERCRSLQRPISYEEIIKSFRAHYPMVKAKTETITRRVRKLKEKHLLVSPSRGKFYPAITRL